MCVAAKHSVDEMIPVFRRCSQSLPTAPDVVALLAGFDMAGTRSVKRTVWDRVIAAAS